jgi:hypothetical protein
MEQNFEINNTTRNKKALMYALITTFCIALIYFIFVPKSFYKFSGIKKDVNDISSYFKNSQSDIKVDIEKGKGLIEKTKINSNQ